MGLGDRLRRTQGSQIIVPTDRGWRIDTIFFDSIDNRIYRWNVEEYDTILKIKKEPNITPRNWIKEYPYDKSRSK